MNYVDGTQEEVIWHPVVRNVYIGTTVVKILLEIFFVHNIYSEWARISDGHKIHADRYPSAAAHSEQRWASGWRAIPGHCAAFLFPSLAHSRPVLLPSWFGGTLRLQSGISSVDFTDMDKINCNTIGHKSALFRPAFIWKDNISILHDFDAASFYSPPHSRLVLHFAQIVHRSRVCSQSRATRFGKNVLNKTYICTNCSSRLSYRSF